MMDKVLKFSTGLSAILFLVIGFAWLFVPQVISEQMDMRLLEGAGLSTQVADLGSFFITMGACMLIGLKTGNRIWFYPVMMMLIIVASGRILAWLIHGATLTIDMIIVEVIVSILLYVVSTKLTVKNDSV